MSGYSRSADRWLGRARMLELLRHPEEAFPGASRSLYLPPGLSPARTESSLGQVPDVPEELAALAADSKMGLVLFRGDSAIYLILPPFPPPERSSPGLDVEPLCSLISRDHKIALVLVRLGAYAVGVSEGERLVSSKTGTGLIHSRHKKGGSSQARFRRHREKQMEYFFTRLCQHAREQFEPHLETLEYLVYGGARTTILALQKACPFLARFDGVLLPPLLDIPEPRLATLESAVSRVWSSRLVEWHRV